MADERPFTSEHQFDVYRRCAPVNVKRLIQRFNNTQNYVDKMVNTETPLPQSKLRPPTPRPPTPRPPLRRYSSANSLPTSSSLSSETNTHQCTTENETNDRKQMYLCRRCKSLQLYKDTGCQKNFPEAVIGAISKPRYHKKTIGCQTPYQPPPLLPPVHYQETLQNYCFESSPIGDGLPNAFVCRSDTIISKTKTGFSIVVDIFNEPISSHTLLSGLSNVTFK